LFFRRLKWWRDCVAKEIENGNIPELHGNAATGWVPMLLLDYCYPEGVIRLFEPVTDKNGEIMHDRNGEIVATTGSELLVEKSPYKSKTVNTVLMALRKHGWLHTWNGNHGYPLHSPIFKFGDCPGTLQERPQIAPGETFRATLKKKPNEINAGIADHTKDTKYAPRPIRRPASQFEAARRYAALREEKERTAGSLATAPFGGALTRPPNTVTPSSCPGMAAVTPRFPLAAYQQKRTPDEE